MAAGFASWRSWLCWSAVNGRGWRRTRIPACPRDEFVLHLSDNGIGAHGEVLQPGMGMTVISAWVEALGGQWSLQPSPSGTTLMATFPCA